MLLDTDFATSLLFIDNNAADRKFFAEGLKQQSPDYRIYEAHDGASGLALYRSQRIDCVLLDLNFPDQSGFEVLVSLVPIARRPNVAVIILTRLMHRGLWELVKLNGAYACVLKDHTSAEALDNTIHSAIAVVGMLPKEDRYRPF
jgi:DNA-binding NarL/FixJ family response regulator